TTKNGDYYTTGLWTNEFQYRGLDDIPLDTLWAEVAITADRNDDQTIDYQDAAIARRDDIGSKRIGIENAQNSVSMIAMNVGSAAQYPFLRILDNIKKFHAGTDGFEQNILIKGYQSEGHDASHPDYANISSRAGGLQDFNVLLEESGKYGAKIGVHINHTEAYPEAKQYSKQLVSDTLGWTWYDDSYHILRENDILNQENGLEKRLDDLAALTQGKLSMIYVDTYQDSRWQADKLAKKITDLGWTLGTEYSEELIKYSTWSHTVNAANSKYDSQGNLVRFIDNQTKDIFGNSPLFRGFDNRNNNAGFYGWQECKSYDTTIENFFTKVLPQKYLANFPVSQWTKDKVTLGKDNQVVTQMVDGINQITKDGNLIADGNNLFIPWNPAEENKIYHWNENGGKTTWTIPASWNNQKSVKLYRLSDQGRTEESILNVQEGTVTIDASAKCGYVIYKDSDPVAATNLSTYDWSIGSPVKDMGFDSHSFGYAWEKSSTLGSTQHITYENNAKKDAAPRDAADNAMGNTHIHVSGPADATLTQTMENLVPGQSYSASVFMEAADERKLSIEITTPDGQTVSNEVHDFTVPYSVPHNDRFATAYQRVKLTFTQPQDAATAVIKLTAAESDHADSWANFDNVRVTPITVLKPEGHLYFEDFEHIDQEFGPFVCPTKVTQSHLSERNGDWTSDVIDGTYSLKIRGNGNTKQQFNHMRTISHRLRLLPNTTYTMGFDYMVTDVKANKDIWTGTPAFVLGIKSDKATAAGDTASATLLEQNCDAKDSTAQKLTKLTFTTGAYDDYYIDLLDNTYAHEFIIDNLYVDPVVQNGSH
ncbi:MAG: endo-alpha-N-acetylgalactosaminidase family protein, partial [Hungatella sp.]